MYVGTVMIQKTCMGSCPVLILRTFYFFDKLLRLLNFVYVRSNVLCHYDVMSTSALSLFLLRLPELCTCICIYGFLHTTYVRHFYVQLYPIVCCRVHQSHYKTMPFFKRTVYHANICVSASACPSNFCPFLSVCLPCIATHLYSRL